MKSKLLALAGGVLGVLAVPAASLAAVTPATDETIAQSAMDTITGKGGLVAAVIVGAVAAVALGRFAWVGLKVAGKAIGKIG